MKSFREKVKYNIKDEAHATKMYRAMAKVAVTKGDKNALREMARDEQDHHKKLLVIKSRLDRKR